MPFTVSDFEDLLEILRQHPEWRERLLETLLGEKFLALPEQVQSLIQAQQRTDEQLAALAAEVRALAEAQRRTEEEFARYREETNERLTRLERAVEELAEVQRQMVDAQRQMYEEFVAFRSETTRRLDDLTREVKNLSARVGMSLEEEAEDMVWWVLQQKGYRFSAGYRSVVYDGEVDVALIGVTPEGESITVVIEGKTRLGRGDVFAWQQRVQSESFRSRMEALGFAPPYLPYFFAMRPDPAAIEAAKEVGIGLVTSRGEAAEGKLIIR